MMRHHKMLQIDERRRQRKHVQLRCPYQLFAATGLLMLLAACGATPQVIVQPTQVPAATRLVQAFAPSAAASPTQPTATTEHTTAEVANTVTSAGVPSIVVPTPDPRVRANCKQPDVQTATTDVQASIHADITVSPQRVVRPISPLIYGLAGDKQDTEHFRSLGTPLVRWGGNSVSRHNWEIGASNVGADWYFWNVSQGWPDHAPSQAADRFIQFSKDIGAEAILTIPTIGYVARDGNNETRSEFVPAQGGPPLKPKSEAIAGYDPAENQRRTSVPAFARKGKPFTDPPDLKDDVVYQDEWVNHIVNRFGRANQGGLRFYALDNEPDLWSYTHRDIRPVQMGYDEMMAMFEEYADAIKDVDPSAQIIAPEISGVTPLYFSSLDRSDDNFRTHADRNRHGGIPFLRWFLEEARIRDRAAGRRRLDVVSVHHYPQGGQWPEGTDEQTNALRLRSTQELWNPEYTNESWIRNTEGAELELIPRLREWVATHYPETKIGITEWNYGADNSLNGALTIVDVLGIFGREGLDLATYWRSPAPATPGAAAFQLYGNYDGCGRHFGDQSIAVQSSDEQSLAAYASLDNHTGDVLLIMVNKLPNKTVNAHIDLGGIGAHHVQVYRIDDERSGIRRLPDVQTDGVKLDYAAPQYSATLLVFKQR